ncbi:ATP-binding cassette domain-containing protein [Streptomyces rimosus]|uniref:ATP-binding cassette domain-containing protein n=1 Tax=Streptomyces rimosus TaxID=1927 RepID=UPI0004BF0EBC|nr:ATP-binding cassette domain-containing protein [Streptomyces rimosus]
MTQASRRTSVIRFDAVHLPSAAPPSVGISFTVPAGELAAVVSPEPSLASAVADLATGLAAPAAGTVRLFGDAPLAALRDGRAGAASRHCGLLQQVTVSELLAIVAELAGGRRPAPELTEWAGVGGLLRRRTESLTVGERAQVSLAVALAGAPELLILEEPTGLDEAERERLLVPARAEAAAGRTVLLVTCDIDAVSDLADRFLIVDRSGLVADASAAELAAGSAARTLTFYAPTATEDLLRGLPGTLRIRLAQGRARLSTTDVAATLAGLRDAGIEPRRLQVGDGRVADRYQQLVEPGGGDASGAAKTTEGAAS